MQNGDKGGWGECGSDTYDWPLITLQTGLVYGSRQWAWNMHVFATVRACVSECTCPAGAV